MTLQPMLQARDLVKDLGGRQVLEGLNLAAMPGEVVGLLGKNGAGKSTLLDLLLGIALPTSGEVRVFDEHSAKLSPVAMARIGLRCLAAAIGAACSTRWLAPPCCCVRWAMYAGAALIGAASSVHEITSP